MPKSSKKITGGTATSIAKSGTPRSLAVANAGIKTSHDFSNLMSSLMSDLIDGRIAPNVGNATVNAGGKLLKMVEMQFKYGKNSAGQENGKVLSLTASFEG